MKMALKTPAVLMFLVSIASYLAASPCSAQTTADLSVSGSYSGFNDANSGPPPFMNPPTTTGGSITTTRTQTWTLTARNLGPGDVESAVVSLTVASTLSPFLVATTDPGCSLSSPTPPFNAAAWSIGPLLAGASATCVITLRVSPEVFPQRSSLTAQISASGNTDPVPSNNRNAPLFVFASPRDFIRDMALSIRSPAEMVTNDRYSTIDFTLTNRGPGDEGFSPPFTQLVFSAPYRVGAGTDESFGFSSSGDPDCEYRVSDIGQVTFVRSSELIFGPLPPGASRTCTLLVFAAPGATGMRQLNWYNPTEGPGTFDTDISNNTATMTLQFTPAAVTAMSRWSLILASVLVFSLGLVATQLNSQGREAR